ncbi:MAG TPA: phosphate-starvation-inducible PsiE family protein [Solirubrobacteraceae bacterium]|nr:phosphate-starvation-inducible PsiE family protein [Solirubrobacteraceae bacterium]
MLRTRATLNLLAIVDHVLNFAVAVVLLVVAAIVLWHTAYDLATSDQPFVTATTTALNGVLFTIIILEVLRTVVEHLKHGGVQLQPFLVIGTISAVRSILAVGARLSLASGMRQPAPSLVHTALLELAVNAAVVLGLSAAIVLVRRYAGLREDL